MAHYTLLVILAARVIRKCAGFGCCPAGAHAGKPGSSLSDRNPPVLPSTRIRSLLKIGKPGVSLLPASAGNVFVTPLAVRAKITGTG